MCARYRARYGELAERLVAVVEGEPSTCSRPRPGLADDVLRDARIDAVTITCTSRRRRSPCRSATCRSPSPGALVSVRLAHGLGEAPRSAPRYGPWSLWGPTWGSARRPSRRRDRRASSAGADLGRARVDAHRDGRGDAPGLGGDEDAPRYLIRRRRAPDPAGPGELLASLHASKPDTPRASGAGAIAPSISYLIVYGDETIRRDDLVVPHPRATNGSSCSRPGRRWIGCRDPGRGPRRRSAGRAPTMRRTGAGILTIAVLIGGAVGFILDTMLTAMGRPTFSRRRACRHLSDYSVRSSSCWLVYRCTRAVRGQGGGGSSLPGATDRDARPGVVVARRRLIRLLAGSLVFLTTRPVTPSLGS